MCRVGASIAPPMGWEVTILRRTRGGRVLGYPKIHFRRLDSEGKLGLQRQRILGLPDSGTVPRTDSVGKQWRG